MGFYFRAEKSTAAANLSTSRRLTGDLGGPDCQAGKAWDSILIRPRYLRFG